MGEVALKAGNLDLVYQDGFIRYIRLGELEVIRMINHALRDHNWGTIPMEIRDEKMEIESDSFQISYSASFQKGEIDFELNCMIYGNQNGFVDFHYEGIAKKDFRRNRIGFTVLHPITTCKGKKVKIVHPDGRKSENRFPEDISPHQPFFDIREMHWDLAEGVKASLVFDGDVFETEDQRNWTDASYKTYCTPLGIPFPVLVKKGTRIQQKVQLKVETPTGTSFSTSKAIPIRISLKNEAIHSPQLGIELKPGTDMEMIRQASQDLSIDFWRIDLELDHDFGAALDLLKKAEATQSAVELCVFSDRQNPVADLEDLKPYFNSVKRMTLFGDSHKTTPKSWFEVIPSLRKLFPQIEIFAGTDAFFTELNRDPLDPEKLDGVSYSINPQVHAFDDQSLVETLEAQAYTVHSAKKLFPGKAINISPVTFHMRWNPNATESGKKFREPTGWTDKRQYSFFGACWLLFSLKYLAESGVNAVTYFDLEGENGWLKTNGKVVKSPMYGLREKLKAYTELFPSQSSQPLKVEVIALNNSEETILILVNWTDEAQSASVPEEFKPNQYSQLWNGDEGKFTWKETGESVKQEFYVVKPNSLTWFSQK